MNRIKKALIIINIINVLLYIINVLLVYDIVKNPGSKWYIADWINWIINF